MSDTYSTLEVARLLGMAERDARTVAIEVGLQHRHVLALERLVLPELGHVVGEATKQPGQHRA